MTPARAEGRLFFSRQSHIRSCKAAWVCGLSGEALSGSQDETFLDINRIHGEEYCSPQFISWKELDLCFKQEVH